MATVAPIHVQVAPAGRIAVGAAVVVAGAAAANSRTRRSRISACQAGFVAGSIAEFTKVSCIYPLDLLRNRLSCSNAGVYSGMLDCFVKTLRGEGVRGFYKGIGATYISNMGKGTVGFGMYDNFLARFSPQRGTQRDPFAAVVQAAVASSLIASIFEGPLEIMAVQLQTQHMHATQGQLQARQGHGGCTIQMVNAELRARHATQVRYGHSGSADILQAIARHRAWGLGCGPLVLRNAMWFTATFGTFEQTKAAAARLSLGSDSKDAQARLGLGWRVACGATTGVVSWTTSFPLEVVKVNMMGQPLALQYRTYSSSMECAKRLYREGGARRFYRGLAPTILRAVPAYTIVLNVYDKMLEQLVRA